ncbi:Uncharacterised protein [Bordetella pertussis]|nr:Uncharacterised protein [Bordetella pertussis]
MAKRGSLASSGRSARAQKARHSASLAMPRMMGLSAVAKSWYGHSDSCPAPARAGSVPRAQ